MSESRFVDLYEILQVSPNADPDTLERVFRLLAKRYHPDNGETGNPERFRELSGAYEVLSDPEKRASYDARYETGRKNHWSAFLQAPTSGVEEDRRTQQLILSLLYQLRRRGPSDPGIGGLELENYLSLTESQLEFCIWYLREKGWVGVTEQGKYAITVDGVDWISERDQLLRKDRLLEEGGASADAEESHHASGPSEQPPSLPYLDDFVQEDPPESPRSEESGEDGPLEPTL